MSESHGPVDAALDLFVYVPVGLAVTAVEELPKLAAKGRSRLDTRFRMAKVVGQFAVSQARRQVESRLGQMASQAPPAPSPSSPSPAPPAADGLATVSPLMAAPAPPFEEPVGEGPGDSGVDTATDRTDPSVLAIPGYDSLSASQVVQRLAGLGAGELDAVQGYETAHRARRTILNRIAQLRAD